MLHRTKFKPFVLPTNRPATPLMSQVRLTEHGCSSTGNKGWVRVCENSTRQESVSYPNPLGTGRVPHVRLSVRGPRMIFFDCFQLDGSATPNGFSLTDSLKRSWASPVLFGPRTLRRTWGTRPVPNGFG